MGSSRADPEVVLSLPGAQNRHARAPWVCWRESTVATRGPSDWGPSRAPARSGTHPNLDSWPTADDPELGFVSNSNLWSNAKRVHLLSNLLSKLRICPGTLSRRRRTYVPSGRQKSLCWRNRLRGLLSGGSGAVHTPPGRAESARAWAMGMLAGINRRYPRTKRLGAAPSSNAI